MISEEVRGARFDSGCSAEFVDMSWEECADYVRVDKDAHPGRMLPGLTLPTTSIPDMDWDRAEQEPLPLSREVSRHDFGMIYMLFIPDPAYDLETFPGLGGDGDDDR